LLDGELLREAGEELEQRAVRDRAAQLRVHLLVDRARIEEPLDEPGGRAVREALELGDVERPLRGELFQHEWMRDLRLAAERAHRAVEPTLPAVRAGERARGFSIVRGELRQRAETLALGRRVVDAPRERRQRPAARPAAYV